MGNNLKKLRIDRGWTHEKAAEEMGVSRSQFIKLERGDRRLTDDYIRMAARAFEVDDASIIAEDHTVPVVGYVGAGSQLYLYVEGQDTGEKVPAPKGSSERTVAVEIRGDSLGAIFETWLVFYDDRREPLTADMIGKLCVLGLDDGRVVVKRLRRGQVRNRWTLESHFEAPLYDVVVEWGAVVKQMAPR